MRTLVALVAVVATVIGSLGFAAPARGATGIKVAIIVGPVGAELTPVYRDLATQAERAAKERGATVATAYSPDATADKVLDAVDGASIVVYLGHGVGSPNPYSDHPSPATTNGWGLNGPNAKGDDRDSWKDGSLAYYGEEWIAANAHPAPGWVMIYSNACYAPGASEGFDEPATEEVAIERVAAYSRAPLTEMRASAYFATDFYAGAASLIATLLDHPDLPYADVFAGDPNYQADAVTTHPHPLLDEAEIRLQRSAYFDGKVDYWYAFAGDPNASLASGAGAAVASGTTAATAVPPLTAVGGTAVGLASSYSETAGWEGQATVALPVALGGGIPDGDPTYVEVCADRCVTLPVVDSCPCYVGTPDQRVANLSLAAWGLVTDLPIEEGLVRVEVHLAPPAPPGANPAA